jgi:hypothetical protein
MEAYRMAGYRYMDLVVLVTKARRDQSERLDRGILTEAQALAEYAQLMNAVNGIEQQRDGGPR